MASFSVITNLASVNAQSNLYSTNVGLKTALNRVSSGLPHQLLGRRRRRPRGGQLVPVGPRGAQPGRPQRQRRAVEPADQGRRARQRVEAARSSLDAGDAVGFGSDLVGLARHAEPGVPGRPQRNHARIQRRGSRHGAGLLGVRQQQRHQRRGRGQHRRGDAHLARRSTRRTSTRRRGADRGGDGATAISNLGTVQGQVGQLQNRLSYAISLAQSQIVNTRPPRAASATRTSRRNRPT